MAGGRSLVRSGAPDRPARVDGDTPPAFAHLPCLSPQHSNHRQQGIPPADGYRGGAYRGLLEELGWTGFAIAQAEAALRYPDHRAHHGRRCGERFISLRTTCGEALLHLERSPCHSF